MVKNTTGGTKTKGLARKHQRGGGGDGKLRLPSESLEQVACVTSMLGNGMCEIYTEKNEKLIGHIRNKFRGRHKRHNLITAPSIVLIGLRDWENPYKNCDILTLYDDSQVKQLEDIPSINIKHVLQLQHRLSNLGHVSKTEDINFTNDDDDEEDEPQNTMKHGETFSLGKISEVDIDDI